MTDNQQLCHIFNTFFTQIEPVLVENISQPGVLTVSSFLSGINKTTLFVKPIDEEVRITILSSKINHL